MFFKLVEERRTRVVYSRDNSNAIGWLKFKGVDGAIIKRRLYQRNDTKQLYFRYKGQVMPHYEY